MNEAEEGEPAWNDVNKAEEGEPARKKDGVHLEGNLMVMY